jgi:hypothetical protein
LRVDNTVALVGARRQLQPIRTGRRSTEYDLTEPDDEKNWQCNQHEWQDQGNSGDSQHQNDKEQEKNQQLQWEKHHKSQYPEWEQQQEKQNLER